ncbi:MAG: DoxX family protein [Polyangiaceae bacterium]|nr:DoxX family protein [Polyangiaceae bacterium]
MSLRARLAATTTEPAPSAALALLRVAFGGTLALVHGWGKVADLGGFTAKVAQLFPLPEVLGPFAAFSELAGGALVALGLLTRPAAAAVLLTMLGAAFVVHGGDPFARRELALAYAAAALALAVAGGGRWSLDALVWGRRG